MYFSNYDIVGLSETKTCIYDEIRMKNFKLVAKHRLNCKRKSGGIGILINEQIYDSVEVLTNDSEFVSWIKIKGSLFNSTEDVIIGVVYIPPEGSDYSTIDSFNDLETELLSMRNSSKYVYLIGDFNARTGDKQDIFIPNLNENEQELFGIDDEVAQYLNEAQALNAMNVPLVRNSMDKSKNNYGNALLELCKNSNMYICNGRVNGDTDGKFTCKGASVVDYLITSIDGLSLTDYLNVEPFSPFLSDIHNALSIHITMEVKIIKKQNISHTQIKWDNDKLNSFIENIEGSEVDAINSSLDSTGSITQNTLNELLTKIDSLFLKSAKKTFTNEKHIHVHPPRNKNISKNIHKPWFGYKCKQAQKEYHLAKNHYARNKGDTNKRQLKVKSKHYKRITKLYHSKYNYQFQTKLRKMSFEKPKKYWNLINGVGKSKQFLPVSPENMFEHFKKQNQSDSETQFTPPDADHNENNVHVPSESLNAPFTSDEINKILKNLKRNKSSGLDSIKNEYIIHTKELMMPIYVKLFNIILDTGLIPASWTEGLIVPIYKNKGSKEDPNNYRPITLLSCIGKVFTSLLNERITNYLSENELLKETQTGFRQNYSTLDNLLTLQLLINYLKSKKKKLFCTFIDFSKAFDNVWRIGLWRKVLDIGISGKIFRVILNLYKNIKSCISINGEHSSFFTCDKGVRQGENLSPLLFSIFLNDVENYMILNNAPGVACSVVETDIVLFIKLYILLYADDTIVMSENPAELQYMLNIFQNYCEEWELSINIDKTKVIVFNGSAKQSSYNFTINNKHIEIVKEYKYLGLLFTSNGRFIQALKHQCNLAKKATVLLKKRIYNLNLPPDLQIKLFDQTIVPILLYGCEISGYENHEILEKVHLYFLKGILKMKKSTPNAMVYGEFGRHPLSINIQTRMISYWAKILSGKDTKYSKNMYDITFSLNKENQFHSKWLESIKSILENTGLSYIWLNQYVPNTKYLIKIVKQRLKDQFFQSWHSSVQISSKCINYRLYKHELPLEKYVLSLPVNLRISISRFRTTNNRLPIETGRWDNIERNERNCQLCFSSEIGDEFHYLLKCTYFRNERKKLLPKFVNSRPNVMKFNSLMNTENIVTLQNLAKYLIIVFSKF